MTQWDDFREEQFEDPAFCCRYIALLTAHTVAGDKLRWALRQLVDTPVNTEEGVDMPSAEWFVSKVTSAIADFDNSVKDL